MITKYKYFEIFNYNIKLDKKRYKKYSETGKWFYKHNSTNDKIICEGYATIEDAYISASIAECDYLISNTQTKIKRLNSIISDIDDRIKTKTISKDTKYEKYKLNEFYVLCITSIKDHDDYLKEIKKYKKTIINS